MYYYVILLSYFTLCFGLKINLLGLQFSFREIVTYNKFFLNNNGRSLKAYRDQVGSWLFENLHTSTIIYLYIPAANIFHWKSGSRPKIWKTRFSSLNILL